MQLPRRRRQPTNGHDSYASQTAPPALLAQWTRLIVSATARAARNQYDAAGAICCVRRHNDVTRCDDIDMPPYGPLLCTRDVIRKPEEHNIAMLIDEGRDTAIQAPDFIADCIPDTGETRKSYHTCHCTYNAMGTVCW